ncbi:probable ADP-ribosylation factor GTPase-activating protein AGD14 isoform X2 [Andrographis paniculata]|uniref:probable ADP-ribosylation factor GTPase-activating protein AGD14 isoform X2 n=1 Tax=Andrographis paniculata TaxID=175694 RepID=UPI0021E839D0|nr:probable ADP-ribosylation factor GTPase-activating protein AGD14 isoform X2 [Andrographis paniculata]
MNSRREEERNEKIIRGLMKLPPNRRCINCNSLGPQYVCTNFWTFVCVTCSGIHREFTHRVKSVSMAKFTSQEVDALQKGGNQRAKELFLKAWDPNRNRLPDNSNVDKLRLFIKSVYIDKKYSLEKPSDKPPRDPQSLRSHREDETRRASSYHSYSQSPPYDFQYEERQYGKHAPGLTRRVGSDHGLYGGKLAGFLSPTHLSDDGFASEGSFSRASDYSVSGGGDAFRSDFFSPSPNRDAAGSPFSDASGEMPSKIPPPHTAVHDSTRKGRSNEGRNRSASSESFASFDSSSTFKSAISLPKGGSHPAASTEDALHKSSSCPSLPQSSSSANFIQLDLFSAPFAPQDVAGRNTHSPPASSGNSQSPPVDLFAVPSQEKSEIPQSQTLDLFAAPSKQQSKLPQPPPVDLFDTLSLQHSKMPQTSHSPQPLLVDLFAASPQQSDNPQPPSVDLFAAPQPQSNLSQPASLDFFAAPQQQSSQAQSLTTQPPPLDSLTALNQQQSVGSHSGEASNVAVPGNGGWATFDLPPNMSKDTQYSVPATAPSSDRNTSGTFNPFSDYPSSCQDSSSHGASSLEHAFGPGILKTADVSRSHTDLWNAFEDYSGGQINSGVLKSDEKAAVPCVSDANQSLGFGGYEMLNNDGNVRTPSHVEPPAASVPSYGSTMAGAHSLVTDVKPTNPFDIPYDSAMESSSMFWDMSSLQATLPNTQMPTSDVDGVGNEMWFPQGAVPSYVPGGVSFDPSSGSLGFMAGQAPPPQIPNVHHAQGPVATASSSSSSSAGGNPFA